MKILEDFVVVAPMELSIFVVAFGAAVIDGVAVGGVAVVYIVAGIFLIYKKKN